MVCHFCMNYSFKYLYKKIVVFIICLSHISVLEQLKLNYSLLNDFKA